MYHFNYASVAFIRPINVLINIRFSHVTLNCEVFLKNNLIKIIIMIK